MITPELAAQSDRLLALGCLWFERAGTALISGDKTGFTVARLAHAMVVKAHQSLRGQKEPS